MSIEKEVGEKSESAKGLHTYRELKFSEDQIYINKYFSDYTPEEKGTFNRLKSY